MKPVSGRRPCKALESRGWVFDRLKSSHHVYRKPGEVLSLSVPVHGNEDMATGTQRRLMKPAGLTDDDL